MYLVFLSISLDFQVDATNDRVNKPFYTLVMSRVKYPEKISALHVFISCLMDLMGLYCLRSVPLIFDPCFFHFLFVIVGMTVE